MSNSSLLAGCFCFFATLVEGLFCYINVYLNTGTLFVNFSFRLFHSLVMFQFQFPVWVLAKCMVTNPCFSSSIPCVGYSSWRPLQGCPIPINVSLNASLKAQ